MLSEVVSAVVSEVVSAVVSEVVSAVVVVVEPVRTGGRRGARSAHPVT